MVLAITLKASARVFLSKETGLFVAVCDAIDVPSQGRTIVEAKQAIQGAFTMWVEHCASRGILFTQLEKRGLVFVKEASQQTGDFFVETTVRLTRSLAYAWVSRGGDA